MRVRLFLQQASVLFAIVVFAGGCASAPTRSEPPVAVESDESSVEIHFVRGHNNHRLFAALKGGAAMAQSFLEHQILAESIVDRSHYLSFLKQASEFLKAPHGAFPERFPCRAPFTVTVRIGAETRAASGCLGSDEGALSHLVRDGEFLLHQGSGMRVK